ncbi:hypothetical protein O3P69_004284 [Scylla paramamosain]|uniref:Uncharacterized protein n=1 Tax=Scylla paramamosain TaxID=85552 RepID=A0AAW0UG99_SCYPA
MHSSPPREGDDPWEAQDWKAEECFSSQQTRHPCHRRDGIISPSRPTEPGRGVLTEIDAFIMEDKDVARAISTSRLASLAPSSFVYFLDLEQGEEGRPLADEAVEGRAPDAWLCAPGSWLVVPRYFLNRCSVQ